MFGEKLLWLPASTPYCDCLRRLTFLQSPKIYLAFRQEVSITCPDLLSGERFWVDLSQWLKKREQKNSLGRLRNQLKHNASNNVLPGHALGNLAPDFEADG